MCRSSRSAITAYAGAAVLFFSAFITEGFIGAKLGNWGLAKLLDPLAYTPLHALWRSFNPLQRNTLLIQLDQTMLSNRLLWLGEGLQNDHTDGHVDNLARFVGEGRLAIPVPESSADPNAQAYADARYRAGAFGLAVEALPSPGRIEKDGEIAAASYMNFYIGNAVVVVPTYGAANDEAAVELVGALFPDRKAVGLRADHVLTGGGSFHCISQQVPR